MLSSIVTIIVIWSTCLAAIIWCTIILLLFPLHVYRALRIRKKLNKELDFCFKNSPVTYCEIKLLPLGWLEIVNINKEDCLFKIRLVHPSNNFTTQKTPTSEENKIMLVSMDLKEADLIDVKEKMEEFVKKYIPFSSKPVRLVYDQGVVTLHYSWFDFWRYSPKAFFEEFFGPDILQG